MTKKDIAIDVTVGMDVQYVIGLIYEKIDSVEDDFYESANILVGEVEKFLNKRGANVRLIDANVISEKIDKICRSNRLLGM